MLLPACRAGTVELQATLRNTLGFAEQIQFAAERGSKGSNEYDVRLHSLCFVAFHASP